MKSDVEVLVREYEAARAIYEQMAQRMRDLVEQLLTSAKIVPHSVSSRAKGSASLREKLQRPDRSYAKLSDVTDLVGIRITTYFEDDVDRVRDVIDGAFVVDESNSIDKRLHADPTAFGYASLHRICALGPDRTPLKENVAFIDIPFEVQVRSILQHAWAEIEHDIGYKSGASVPAHLRRQFSRIAALLEVADTEFVRVRDGIAVYATKAASEVASKPASLPLDAVSLAAFLDTDRTVTGVAEQVAKSQEAPLVKPQAAAVELATNVLTKSGMTTIGDVSKALTTHQRAVLALGTSAEGGFKEVSAALVLIHLGLLLIGALPSEPRAQAFKELAVPDNLADFVASFASKNGVSRR